MSFWKRCMKCGEKRPVVPEVFKDNPLIYGGTIIYCRECLNEFLDETEQEWKAKYERGEVSKEDFERGLAFNQELRK